jgi:LEA14-like dessication related protein
MHEALRSFTGVWVISAGGAGLAGCTGLPEEEALRVSLVDLQTLPGTGLEVRFAVKLRVQNPGELAVDYDGISLDLDLRGMSFASGVSAERGSLPRFGEVVVTVPMTVSATALLRQALSLAREDGRQRIRIDYSARGRLGGAGRASRSFKDSGQLDWPPRPGSSS